METIPLANPDPTISIMIIILCVFFVAFFSSSEASLISVSRIRIRSLVEKGDKNAMAVSTLRDSHDRLFGTILLTENFFIILASSLGTALAITMFPHREWVTIVASLVMTAFIVMFGEIAPKTFAAAHAEKLALIVARPMAGIIMIMHPLVWLFTRVTNSVIRVIGGKAEASPYVTEEEIKAMITIGQEEGALDVQEEEMLHKVFEFGDTLAVEAMRPRTEMVAVDKGARVSEALALVAQYGHSRYPVIDDTVDNVVGILYTKDIMVAVSKGELDNDSLISRLVRPAYFIPETKRVRELLTEMQAQKLQMVIVIDEYGGTSGIVTMEDLIEEIVGSIRDEFDREESDVHILDEKNCIISGSADLDEVSGEVGINLESEDYNTIGGFVFGLFGRMPRSGETLKYRDLKFEVLEMDERKIAKLKITKP